MQNQPNQQAPVPPSPGLESEMPAPHPVTIPIQGGSPRAVFEAAQAKREVLGDYLGRLLRRRNETAERLANPDIPAAEKSALEAYLRELNARVIDMERQIQAADAEVAAAAGVPGSTVPEPRPARPDGPPEEMFVVGAVFIGISLVILAISFARRLWRGATTVVSQIPIALEARFTRFEQSLDAMAIEIERISEGQRFLTKVFAEQNPRAIGAGPAQPIETKAGVAEPVRRG
jgi:hypothetical protein